MRKIIFTAAVFSIVLLTTQAALLMHLVCEEEHSDHDSHSCPICQQLFVTAKNLAAEEYTAFFHTQNFERGMVLQNNAIPIIFAFHVSGPRAPPAYL
jgi:hypothetical protein